MAEKQPRMDERVCIYCNHLKQGSHRDGYFDGCGLVRNERGQYVRIIHDSEEKTKLEEIGLDTRDVFYGCDKFIPNGMPAHPINYEIIVKANPRCQNVPIDENALEDGWDLQEKILKALPGDAIISWENIQH
ncbi:hypothetical protein HOG16_03705 [Candidatus Woesearchaeota archaeon]|jgi:hypothetical protein|nr:hypothetical protein [Candidatus Woesearchaeota archaeon]MBT4321628.1 hypothetical protein [Candidatus Woesearchaeota archaeon]MBT4631061.1 hypothetical protein [Candidatus Woesearchaeota archaeon]